MKCWSCKAVLADPEFGKITFRAECEKCGVALHACSNCKYFHPGRPNDCEVPGTEFIADRTKANLCEEFRLRPEGQSRVSPCLNDIENKLFGTSSNQNSKQSPENKFNSLFKEDDNHSTLG